MKQTNDTAGQSSASGRDTITVISYDKVVEDIGNFADLPAEIRQEIQNVDGLWSSGFQTINGSIGRKCALVIGGYWNCQENNDDPYIPGTRQFVATSYGSDNFQWDGEVMTRARDGSVNDWIRETKGVLADAKMVLDAIHHARMQGHDSSGNPVVLGAALSVALDTTAGRIFQAIAAGDMIGIPGDTPGSVPPC